VKSWEKVWSPRRRKMVTGTATAITITPTRILTRDTRPSFNHESYRASASRVGALPASATRFCTRL
jgi:hypothetical protein